MPDKNERPASPNESEQAKRLIEEGKELPPLPAGYYCNGRNKAKTKYCEHEAGWGVKGKHEGRCKLHGGVTKNKVIKHGAYAKSIPNRLQYLVDDTNNADPIQRFLDNVDALDIYIKYHNERFDRGDINIDELQTNVRVLVDSYRKAMDTINRIVRDQEAISPTEFHLFITRLLQKLKDLLNDVSIPRDQVLDELGEAIQQMTKSM